MGTPLTGQTKASTYDSLLKVTDNGPVGGTEKVVTDGLGNDSALKIGTAGVSSTGTFSAKSASFANSGADVTVDIGSFDNLAARSNTLRIDQAGPANFATLQFTTAGANTSAVRSSTAGNALEAVVGSSIVGAFHSGGLTVTGTVAATVGTLGSMGCRAVTISASAPSGGADGDVWLQYV